MIANALTAVYRIQSFTKLKTIFEIFYISGMRDSNSRPLGPKPSALAIWANPRLDLSWQRPIVVSLLMVGIGGLEPPTSSLSETRSNQLSYMPIA